MLSLKPIGRKSASTFTGFCSYHDRQLFELIETQDFTLTPKQVFLHSYRAFNSSFHHFKEWFRGHLNDENQINRFENNSDYYNFSILRMLEMKLVKEEKEDIDRYLLTEKYDGLHSVFLSFPKQKFPFATCGIASLGLLPNSKPLKNGRHTNIMVTALPEKDGSIVILSCFTMDVGGREFLDNFLTLSFERKREVLSTMIICFTDSTVISPYLWNVLDENGKNDILLNIVASRDRRNFPLKEFPKLKVDLFKPMMDLDMLKAFHKYLESK